MTRQHRRPGVLDLASYDVRRREFAARGAALPQSKLDAATVATIRRAAQRRERLRTLINDRLSNAALARRLGVHVRTVEKALSQETWRHVP